jgi:hypothetical protein
MASAAAQLGGASRRIIGAGARASLASGARALAYGWRRGMARRRITALRVSARGSSASAWRIFVAWRSNGAARGNTYVPAAPRRVLRIGGCRRRKTLRLTAVRRIIVAARGWRRDGAGSRRKLRNIIIMGVISVACGAGGSSGWRGCAQKINTGNAARRKLRHGRLTCSWRLKICVSGGIGGSAVTAAGGRKIEKEKRSASEMAAAWRSGGGLRLLILVSWC